MLIHLPPAGFKYNKEIVDDLYKCRKNIFVERLDWDLETKDDKEIDYYDHSHCHYLVSVENHEVIGGVRLTPSIAPNLTFDLFKGELKLPDHITRGQKLLESSRFGLVKKENSRSIRVIRRKTLEIFEGMLKFSLDYGYERIITVTDVRIERILKISGWPLKRLTEVRPIGNTHALIGMLDVSRLLYNEMREKRISGPLSF